MATDSETVTVAKDDKCYNISVYAIPSVHDFGEEYRKHRFYNTVTCMSDPRRGLDWRLDLLTTYGS